MAVWNLKNFSSIVMSDLGSTVTIALGPGPKDFTHSDIQEGFHDAIDVMDGGEFLETIPGEAQAVDWSLSVHAEGDYARYHDAVMKLNAWAAAATVDPGGVVHRVNVRLIGSRDGVPVTLNLDNNRMKLGQSWALEGNKFTLSGSARGIPGSTSPLYYT